MANLRIKSGSGADAYLAGTGQGTDYDPFVPRHAVTGPLTDDELRAAAIDVAGPLTDGELRAAPVSVTGPLTKAQLDASIVTVTGTLDYTPLVVTLLNTVSWLPVGQEGDLTVIAAPGAGLRIVFDEIFLQNETAAPCVVVINGTNGFPYRRVRLVGDGDFMHWMFETGKELRLPENVGCVLNRAGTTQLGYLLRFRYESVD